MPRTYSINEYVDMIYSHLYGFCNGNVNAARCEYATQFSNRKLSDKSIFSLTFQRLKETGSFNIVRELMEFLHHCKMKEEQLSYCNIQSKSINKYPKIWFCVRNFTRSHMEDTFSRWTSQYHFQCVQHLLPADLPRRRAFCNCF